MSKITQAVILAGGAGTRLRPYTLKNPKPMIPIKGRPFLEHLLVQLKENDIKEVLILTGYFGEKIKKHFGSGEKFGIKIRYSDTPFLNGHGEENQSGLRIKNALKLLNDFFLLIYCDNYWPFNLSSHLKYFQSHPSEVLITVFSNLDKSTKNNTFVDKFGYVQEYDKSRQKKDLNGVEIGYMLINKKVLKLLPKTNSKFEDIFPKLISKKSLSAFLTDQKYYSIGNLQRVKLLQKFLLPKKVVFLDRDGVINKKVKKADYVKKWEEFEFLPGAIGGIKILNSKGYKIFIISNQAGIARGKMFQKDLDLIHKKMIIELKTGGAKIDGIYYCPHSWDESCNCRKPKPGMLFQASREHFFDLQKTVLIGDDLRDIKAGKAVGAKTYLVDKKHSLLDIVRDLK